MENQGNESCDTSENKRYTRKESAYLLSKLLFWWVVPLVRKGNSTSLNVSDFDSATKEDEVENLTTRICASWELERKRPKPNLHRAFFRTFGKELCLCLLTLWFCQTVLKLGNTIVLGCILQNLESNHPNKATAWSLCAVFIIGNFTTTFFFHHASCFVQHIGAKARIAFTGLISQKVVRLDQTAVAKAGAGSVISLVSNDVSRFDRSTQLAIFVFVAPLQFLVAVIIVYHYLGPPALTAVVFVVVIGVYQAYLGKVIAINRFAIAKWTDQRVRLLSELLTGLQIVKQFTWENLYTNYINDVRRNEVKLIMKKVTFQAIDASIFEINTKIIILATFLTYVFGGNLLTAEKVFVVLAIYNSLSVSLGIQFPVGSYIFAELVASVARIQEFLLLEERCVDCIVSYKNSNGDSHSICVDVQNLCIKWPDVDQPVFANVSFSAMSNDLITIVGSVGSGKSTLLLALLSELTPHSGEVVVNGSVAYAAQDPWLTTESIRENILFGSAYEPAWYNEVVEACALAVDFETLRYGDQTLLADKGSNLSGGQKARINLARACYSKADIYLLDDPLSAVDTKVARHLLDNCIQGILKDKCVFLVTHQTHLLPSRSKVISLDTITQFHALEPDFQIDVLENNFETTASMRNDGDGYGTFQSKTEETQSIGRLKMATVLEYYCAGNSKSSLVLSLCLMTICQALMSFSDIWLKIWTNSDTQYSITSQIAPQVKYVVVFVILIFGATIFSFTKTLKVFYDIVRAAVTLHNRLLHAICRVPMRFLEINSAGRVLNRFTYDLNLMDELLPQRTYLVLLQFFQLMGAIVVVCIQEALLIVPSVIIILLEFALFYFNLSSAATIKRLDGISRSPVLSELTATISGLATIRAYKKQDISLKNINAAINTHASVYMAYVYTSRWFQQTFELVADVYAMIVIVSLTMFTTGSSTFGLVGSSLLTVITSLTSFSMIGELAIQMTSPERVIEYSKVGPEAPLRVPTRKPSSNWPSNGAIRMNNLFVRYQDGPIVLQNISLNINPKEKVGIIGRTGAGKSSLVSALFRLVEKNAGFIHVDSIDVSKIGLHDLRGKISIIPQTPFLFHGTVRNSIDPFGQFSDVEIWDALSDVQLLERLRVESGGLNTMLEDGALNFSVGERQLLCIARTILLKNKIVVLDEATSSIDSKTDRIIQEVLRERFKDCTMLVIAHRLNTVMDCDRILVLDAGQIVEFDEPQNLIDNPESRFYKLVHRTGKSNAQLLRSRLKTRSKLK